MYEERYKLALYHTCRMSAAIEDIVLKKENGYAYEKEYVEDILKEFQIAKQELLVEKRKAGYGDCLEFMENAAFCGFSLQNGIVEGDYHKIPVVCRPWVDAAQSESNRFRFEVGILLYSHYMMRQGMFKEFKPLPYFMNRRNFKMFCFLSIKKIRDGLLRTLYHLMQKKEEKTDSYENFDSVMNEHEI